MQDITLFESEYRVMDFAWRHENSRAKEIAAHCLQTYAWTKNTTYSIINRLIAKGYLERKEPGFVCAPLIAQQDVRLSEAKSVVGKFFEGSYKMLFAELLAAEEISQEELSALKGMIEEADERG